MTKVVLKASSNIIFYMKKANLDNRNWTSKIQVILLFVFVSWKKECSRNFKTFSEEVILMRCEKMKRKKIKEYMWKSFYCKLAGWVLPNLLQINFFTDNFQGFWLNEILLLTISRCYSKCLKSTTCEIVIVHAGWNSATCIWNDQSPKVSL